MLFFIFVLGLCMGSFLNVVIFRFPKEEKISGRSHCPHCKKIIAWYDLIPVFSFLLLLGKCRNCRERISWQYPIVELSAGILFMAVFSAVYPGYFDPWNFALLVYWLTAACFLILIFFIDLKHYIIPDQFVFSLILICFAFNALFDFSRFKNGWVFIWDESVFISGLFASVLSGGFFLLIILISRGKWMGLGDAKFAIFMGAFFGFPKIVCALFLAFAMGAIMGIGLIILKKKKLGSEIPFGPFLVAGTIISMFFGEQAMGWYLKLLI